MKNLFTSAILITALFGFSSGYTLAATTQVNNEDYDLFYEAVDNYFNGEPGVALAKLYAIENSFVNDPVFYEYKARCIFEIIKGEANIKTSLKEKGKNKKEIKLQLEELFLQNINAAIRISRALFQETNNSINAYNFIMASEVKAWYLGEIRGERQSPGNLFDSSVDEIYFCLDAEPQFCLAYFPLGITQYVISKNMTWWKKIAYNYLAPAKLRGIINIDKKEAIEFLKYGAYCNIGPEFRKTEAKIALALTLADAETKWNERFFKNNKEAKILLEELTEKFPRNKTLKDKLTLVNFRVKTYKKRFE